MHANEVDNEAPLLDKESVLAWPLFVLFPNEKHHPVNRAIGGDAKTSTPNGGTSSDPPNLA